MVEPEDIIRNAKVHTARIGVGAKIGVSVEWHLLKALTTASGEQDWCVGCKSMKPAPSAPKETTGS